MNCRNCADSGYTFDTLQACHECDLGKPIQYKYDKEELSSILKRANTLHIKKKKYEGLHYDK